MSKIKKALDVAKGVAKEHPTHYLPDVGRQVAKTGGAIDYNVPTRLPIPGEDTEAMFRRLIEFSYAVRRQYRADGGPVEPGDDASKFVHGELSRLEPAEQARFNEITRPSPLLEQYAGHGAREAVEANMPRAMPDAHSFVQHQLRGNEPQLPQMDREAVKKMKEYSAAPLELAAYSLPVVGPALGAVDLARGIHGMAAGARSGDVTEGAANAVNTALAFTGVKGKMAKAAAVGMAGLMPEEARASFFGEAAKMSPAVREALDRARAAIAQGATKQQAWREHGWAPDPSGKFVSELSDEAARINPEGAARFRAGESVKLGDILSHPDLYDLYPSSSQMKVSPFYRDISNRGEYDPVKDVIGSNLRMEDRDLLENLLHEHQHRVQHIEGMSPGTSPSAMIGPEELARPFVEQRDAILGAMNLQRIMRDNPHMDEVDALVHAKERGIPVAAGALQHVRKPYESLADEMGNATAEIEDIHAKVPSKFDQYQRSLGEWTARLPGERLEMTGAERRAAYPFDESFPVINRPISPYLVENPRSPMWEAEREGAIDLARRLQQEPLPSKYPEDEELQALWKNGLLETVRQQNAAARKDKGGSVVGAAIKLLGKLKPEGSGYKPAAGMPELVNLPGIGRVESRPIESIEDVARKYRAGHGFAESDKPLAPLNPEFSSRVAEAYEAMKHDPRDPAVKRAYDALAEETLAQYRAAKDLGLDIRFLKAGERDPYAASPALGYEDIVNRGRLVVFPTEQGFGSTGGLPASNPLLKRAGKIGDKPDAVVNDAFRVIHDLYGHYGPGNPFFRAPGEERAYQLHSRMFSPEARPALTSETRGQNSWVNFGPFAERNRAATGETTHYAEQKAGIMPEWTHAEPPPEGADIDAYIRERRGFDKGGVVFKALEAASKSVPFAERMAVTHALRHSNLEKAQNLGSFVSPSLAVAKSADYDPTGFGSIVFVGKPHLAEPSLSNPVFGQDVWSPRVPHIEKYNHKDFSGPGFYSEAVMKDVPATPENILEHMNSKPTIGGEYRRRLDEEPNDLGYIISSMTPRFKSMEELKDARDRIVSFSEWHKAAKKIEDAHVKTAEDLGAYRPSFDEDEEMTHEDYLGKVLNQMRAANTAYRLPGIWNDKTLHNYYPGIPESDINRLRSHMSDISNMPTRYFEAKPRRIVNFNEFIGATMPKHMMEESAPIVRQMGIEKIVPHEGGLSTLGKSVLEHFPEAHFSHGGDVEREDYADGGVIGKALQAIRAYHGSPHKFDKFDISKIGTGEGAQAYGHGLYFAEAENVAKDYRNKLAPPSVDTGYPNIDSVLRNVYGGDWNSFKAANPTPSESLARSIAAIEARGGPKIEPSRGYMYEVDIHADPAHMLDWDKPLSEQPAGVQKWASKLRLPHDLRAPTLQAVLTRPEYVPQNIPFSNERAAAKSLFKSGIPGIRYLDQGSRGAGEGTSNYVIFDPNIIDIRRRYEEGGDVERDHFDKGGIAAALRAAKNIIEEDGSRIPLDVARQRVASPFSEMPESVQKALDYAQALRVTQGAETIPGSFYNVKQTRPVSEVTSIVEDIPGVSTKSRNPMSWEDIVRQYKGATMFNVAGDRSNLGRLTHINERELAWPVDLHAGPKYMLEPNEGMVWANNPTHASGFQRAIAEASKRGPVIGAYHPMGVQSVDSSHNMIDAILSQVALGDVSKKEMRAVDKLLQKGAQASAKEKVGLASEAMQGWPGLANAQEASEYARGLEGTRRAEIVKFLDKAPMLKKGFPAIGETRVAISDPEMRGVSGNMLGHRIVEFDPNTFEPRTPSAFTHSTYAAPTAGRYVGDVPLVQTQYAMPDVERDIMTKLAKGERVVHPYSHDPLGRASWRKSLETRKLGQEVNQEMLDSIMLGLQRQKDYGFKGGGPVINRALDVISDLPRDADAGTPE